MSFSKKLKKLKRDPKKFFQDSKLFNVFKKNQKDILNTKKESVSIKNSKISENKIVFKNEKLIKKDEPSILGKFNFKNNTLDIELKDKKIINSNLGFSTLFIINNSEQYLINRKSIRVLLKEKDFIAFKEKSIYFLISENNEYFDLEEKDIYEVFLRNKGLRNNSFSLFRNIICINPSNPMFMFIRQSNPFIKTIIIIDNQQSLSYIAKYKNYIDVLIIKDTLVFEYIREIPRVIRYKSFFDSLKFHINRNNSYIFYNNENDLISLQEEKIILNQIKIAILDTSYKKDCNLLLPVLSNTPNLEKIDYYNEDYTINGLIKFKINNNYLETLSFDEILENIEIEELYLRDNLYCVYKDMILDAIKENDFKKLLKKTLYDGVYYEKI